MKVISRILIGVSIAGGVTLFQNCSMVSPAQDYGQSLSMSSEAALQSEAMKVLQVRCYGCHKPELPSGGIDDITDVNKLLYYRLVVPGEPQLSDLYGAIADGSMPPRPNASLSAAEVKVIFDWIQDGFKEDTGVTPPSTTVPIVLGPTYASINRFILRPNCAGCHNGTRAFPLGGTHAELMALMRGGQPMVRPGNAAGSMLYDSVNTGRMPQGGPRLSAAEITAIQMWIQGGALDN